MHAVFARITKVDETTRTVTGRAAQEVLDRDNELFDYDSSVPYFKAWSAEIYADTDGKSMGNVRSMHGNIAAGKVTAMDFNPAEKAIDISAKIIDDNEWEKVLEGVHTGFSIGGRYAKKWGEIMNGKMVTKYTAVPNEISIVDRPCIPTAKFFSVHKRDGTIEKRAFANVQFSKPAIEFIDGEVQLLKGGPGSGPHGGSGDKSSQLAGFASARAKRLSDQGKGKSGNWHTTKDAAKASEKAHEATKQATAATRSGASNAKDLHASAARAHIEAANAHMGTNNAAGFNHESAAEQHLLAAK
jgi:hypothetical protein